MSINKTIRGERKIDLGGATYTMRPTFEVLVELEDKFGSLFTYVKALSAKIDIKLSDVAYIVHKGIEGVLGDRSPTYNEVGAMIVAEGLTNVLPIAIEFIMDGMITEEQAAAVKNGLKKSANKGSKASKK